MAEYKIKMCGCGCKDRNILYTDFGNFYACLIGCMSITCDKSVIRFGFTKNRALKRAVRAWNRRADNG